MQFTEKNAAAFTKHVLREYFLLNTDPFFEILSENSMWIGPGNVYLFGLSAIKEPFEGGFVMPPFVMENGDFISLERVPGESAVVVVGQYDLYPQQPSEHVLSAHQRATFVYQIEDKRYQLKHVHVSNEWNELVDDEVFPTQISTHTYRYVQSLLEESEDDANNRVTIKDGKVEQYIDPGLIFYVEALDKISVLHSPHQRLTVKKTIGELEQIFPDTFCRVHRNYLVNCEFISKIERFKVTLATGETLPIPEKRYREVRRTITSTIMANHPKE